MIPDSSASSIQIVELSSQHFNSILTLSDELFGNGFLNTNSLNEYLANPQKMALVAQYDNLVCGFILLEHCTKNSLLNLALEEKDWFNNYFSAKDSFGILKTIAVNSQFKNKGIGSKLTTIGIETLSKTCSSIVSICWDKKSSTSFNIVLEKSGFTKIKTFNAFWKNDSLLNNYFCEICGAPPCLCNAFIYTIVL